MELVRKSLCEVWERLNLIAKSYNLKGEINQAGRISLAAELEEIESLIRYARVSAEPVHTEVTYAIAKEENAEEYLAFTHGPHPSIHALLECKPENGQILVRIEMSRGGDPQYTALKGYLDGEWIDC